MNRRTLRKARNACGYTQARMASLLGYSVSYYRMMEHGNRPIPSALTFSVLFEKVKSYQNCVLKTITVLCEV